MNSQARPEYVIEHEDKSLAPSPRARAPTPKREKFSWAKPNPPGVFRLIDKSSLMIDARYQRGEVSRAKVMEIARSWDWRLFGVVCVVKRSDGSLWIYDGGHRWRAAGYRDDIRELPCLVFDIGNIEDEARSFVGTNTLISNVSAYHLFRASLLANEPTCVAVQALLDKHGYSVANTKKPYGFTAIHTLRNMVAENAEVASKVFAACVDIASDGEQIPHATMQGMFVMVKRVGDEVLSEKSVAKLRDIGIAGIETAIRREKHIVGKGGDRVQAKAILDLLNKGRRTKLAL